MFQAEGMMQKHRKKKKKEEENIQGTRRTGKSPVHLAHNVPLA